MSVVLSIYHNQSVFRTHICFIYISILYDDNLCVIKDQHQEWEEIEPNGDVNHSDGLVDYVLDLVLERSGRPEVKVDFFRALVWVFRSVNLFLLQTLQ